MAAKKKNGNGPVAAIKKAKKKVSGMGVLMTKKEREELLKGSKKKGTK